MSAGYLYSSACAEIYSDDTARVKLLKGQENFVLAH